jgi:hypothetical protein
VIFVILTLYVKVKTFISQSKTLIYKINPETSNLILLLGYSDADWGGDLEARKSTTGNIFYLANNSISWLSTLQKTVALSTCEAEYMALKEIVKEGLWVSRLITYLNTQLQLKLQVNIPKILCDNEAAIKLAENPEFHKRSKHIDITYHFIRETVQNKNIILQGVKTTEQKANGLTKPLDKNRQEELRNILRIQ